MTNISVSTTINGSAESVWHAITDFAGLPDRDPDVLRVEFLTDEHVGVGTRFRETRRRGKRGELVTELTVTEFDAPTHMRTVADTHDTIWDTIFAIAPEGAGVRLTLLMEARTDSFVKRVLFRLLSGLFRRGMAKYLEWVKHNCESTAAGERNSD